jgi:putative hemolysin
MKKMNKFYLGIVLGLVVLVLIGLIYFLNNSGKENPQDNSSVQIPNPSATKCIEDGYEYEIRTNPDGSQTGYCIFSKEKECVAWEYYRGECTYE